ncbi:MAG: T9SS type A sorting domain-containing protein [Brumimicrobium sp.]
MKNLFKTLLLTLTFLSLSFSGNTQNLLFTVGDPNDKCMDTSDFTFDMSNTFSNSCDFLSFNYPNTMVQTITYTIPVSEITGGGVINDLDIEIDNEYDTWFTESVSFNNNSNGFDYTYNTTTGKYELTNINSNSDLEIVFLYEGSGQLTVYFYEFLFFGEVQTTSVNENNLEDDFQVYSFNKELNVKTDKFENYKLSVYNMGGQLVMNKDLNGNSKNYISNSGIYIVKLEFENQVLTKKVLIQ